MSASPRPWRAFVALPEQPNEVSIFDADGLRAAGPFVTAANAELIVAAVNTEAKMRALIAAADALLTWIAGRGSTPFSTIDHNFQERLTWLRKAAEAAENATANSQPHEGSE